MRRPVQFQELLYDELCRDDEELSPFDFDFEEGSDPSPVKELTKEEKIARRRAQIAKSAHKHRERIRQEIEALQAEKEELEKKLAEETERWKEIAHQERQLREMAETINQHLKDMLGQTKSCVGHWREFMPPRKKSHI
ncbi:hypothetical protein AC1031_012509 [Aphanomyces cochlioides]|nr:hypothetical protein AC1031_012509 [Aphanomyces cochlioides]